MKKIKTIQLKYFCIFLFLFLPQRKLETAEKTSLSLRNFSKLWHHRCMTMLQGTGQNIFGQMENG